MQPNDTLKDIIYRNIKSGKYPLYKGGITMKKLLSTLIIISMLSAAAPFAMAETSNSAVAPTAVSVTDSEAMKTALINVKSRIDVPAELSEFSGNASSYENDGIDYGSSGYIFRWNNPDNSKSLDIYCDTLGRIGAYYYYDRNPVSTDIGKLSKVSESKAKALTNEFVQKLIPEAFADTSDTLEIESFRVSEYSDSEFTVNYKRMKNGNEVYGSNISITADYSNNSVTIIRANISYDYDAAFNDNAASLENPNESYRSAFPEELVYSKEYNYSIWNSEKPEEDKINLLYSLKNPGYISAVTGEKLELKQTPLARPASGIGGASMDSSSKNESSLTSEEITELNEISKLYSADEAEAFIRSLPKLNITSGMKLDSSSMFSLNTLPKKYVLDLYMKDNSADNYQSLSASFDAGHKRLTSLNCYIPSAYYKNSSDEDNKPLTDEQIEKYTKESDKFLNAATDKLSEFKENENNREVYSNLYRSFSRIVNGIPYPDNSIGLTYDTKNDTVTSYYLSYDDDAKFPSPENIISADDAYKKLMEYSPLKLYYIPTDDGYKLAYTVTGYTKIDAFTGEDIDKNDNYNAYDASYNDISGHWCESMVKELAENGIALKGESFNPDTAITQEDLLRILLASNNRYILNADTDTMYDRCYDYKILNKDERNENAAVTREQAFVYMIRIAGYERIAKLNDIYKISYADSDKLSNGLLGYAALLSGMGIINGDGSELRPQDSLTRAEAVTMLYKYMKQ